MVVTTDQPSQRERFLEITTTSSSLVSKTFISYLLSQNAAIIAGKITGIFLNLQVLGVGNGLTVRKIYVMFICTTLDVSQDPLKQYPGYLTYAASNPYHPLVNQSIIDQAMANWSAPDTGCQARVKETITHIFIKPITKSQFCRSLRATMEGLTQYVRRRKVSVTIIFLVH